MNTVQNGMVPFLNVRAAVDAWLAKREAAEKAEELTRIQAYAYVNGTPENYHAPINVTIVKARAKHVKYVLKYSPFN